MPTKQTLADMGYGNPDDPAYRTKFITIFRAGGIELTCHRGLVPNFAYLIRGLSETIDLSRGIRDDWGYVNKGIEGYPPIYKSWHSVGGAIDLDATRNVMGSSKTTFPIRKTLRLCREAGLEWGRTWSSRPDPMHFEVALPLTEMRRIGDRLRAEYRNR